MGDVPRGTFATTPRLDEAWTKQEDDLNAETQRSLR